MEPTEVAYTNKPIFIERGIKQTIIKIVDSPLTFIARDGKKEAWSQTFMATPLLPGLKDTASKSKTTSLYLRSMYKLIGWLKSDDSKGELAQHNLPIPTTIEGYTKEAMLNFMKRVINGRGENMAFQVHPSDNKNYQSELSRYSIDVERLISDDKLFQYLEHNESR